MPASTPRKTHLTLNIDACRGQAYVCKARKPRQIIGAVDEPSEGIYCERGATLWTSEFAAVYFIPAGGHKRGFDLFDRDARQEVRRTESHVISTGIMR
jgi:hypothetical protein